MHPANRDKDCGHGGPAADIGGIDDLRNVATGRSDLERGVGDVKHTPGPWEWRIKKEILVDPKDKEFGFFVGDLEHQTGEKSALLIITTEENKYGQKEIVCFSNANKNLIAAAPDLLEALKRLAEYGDVFRYRIVERNPYEQAVEAIAKAEGK